MCNNAQGLGELHNQNQMPASYRLGQKSAARNPTSNCKKSEAISVIVLLLTAVELYTLILMPIAEPQLKRKKVLF